MTPKDTIMGMIIVAAIIISAIIYFAMIGFDFNPIQEVHTDKTVNIEAYENNNELSHASAFCDSYEGNSGKLNKQCNSLTKKNCLSTDCCVYAKMDNKEGCFAGNEDGPIFKFDTSGKTKDIDYYYYKNLCHGKGCK